jgi:hypothetical protein
MRVPLLQEHPAALVASIAGAVLGLAVVLPLVHAQPYGEQSIIEEIARQDGALCGKSGLEAGTQSFTDCLLDLTDVRARHVALLKSYFWL